MLEAERFLTTAALPDEKSVSVEDLRQAAHVLDLPVLHQLACSASQPLHYLILERTKLVEIDARLAEFEPPRSCMPNLAQQLRDMQQRLRWNAAAIHAHSAGVGLRIDQRNVQSEIRRTECRC